MATASAARAYALAVVLSEDHGLARATGARRGWARAAGARAARSRSQEDLPLVVMNENLAVKKDACVTQLKHQGRAPTLSTLEIDVVLRLSALGGEVIVVGVVGRLSVPPVIIPRELFAMVRPAMLMMAPRAMKVRAP